MKIERVKQRFTVKSLMLLPEVLTLYYFHRLTIHEVSKEIGLSPTTISELLITYGRGIDHTHRKKAPRSN